MIQNVMKSIIKKILFGTLIIALLSGAMVGLLYGFGDEHLEEMKIENVTGEIVTRKGLGGDFDLSKLPNREGTDYRGQAYEGYQDPKQVAMAKELLDIYSNVIKSEGTLLEQLSKEVGTKKALDLLMETLIGIHATETSTYSSNIRANWRGETGVPDEKTYILSNYLVYKDYGNKHTEDGKVMNFKNYNYKDYNKSRLDEDPNTTYTTDTNSTNFHAGYWSTAHRSIAGATGPLQQRVLYWTKDYTYVKNKEQGFVTDVIKYIEDSDPSKRYWSSEVNSDLPDIWNFPHQVESLYRNFIVNHMPTFIQRVGSLKDFELIQGHIFATYHGGAGTHGGNINTESKLNTFHEYIDKMYNDKEFSAEVFDNFKVSKSHGSFRDINIKHKKKNGFGDGLAINYKDFTAGQYSSEYYTKAKFEGIAWYQFLQGIAYGDQENPQTVSPARPGGNKGKIVYNYMNQTNGIRKSQSDLNKSDLDGYMAIGYKGPYPIFNQNMDYNSNLYMGGGYSFRSACTIYAATSGMLGLGETEEYKSFDTDNSGITTPPEFWSHAHSSRNTTPYNITKNPSFGLASIHQTILNAGYKTSGTYSAKGNIQMRKEHIKQGYPVHIRTSGGTTYPGIIPKTSLSELDYRSHDMYDFEAYDWDSPKSYKLAHNGHSLMAVDLIEYRGKEYVSLIDSAYNHSAGYDSSIIWWEADKLLGHTDWANSYTIFGADNLTPIGTGHGGNPIIGTGPPPKPTTTYEGEESGVAVYDLESGTLTEIGLDKNEYSNNTGNVIVGTIKGGYETQIISAQRYEKEPTGMYVITGKSNDITQAIEIKGISNPRKHNAGNRENTELYDLPSGQTAHVRVGFFRKSDGKFIYTDIRND